jgi:mRNA-degrading endonuclease toxin of MazEF toxin-antitoxin module
VEPKISPGTILWVCLRRGRGKERPAVALNSPNSDGRLTIVACSTQSYDRALEVELPSDPKRHPMTKLKKCTFAIVDWIEEISVSDVCEIKGIIPPTTLDRIWDKIRTLSPS